MSAIVVRPKLQAWARIAAYTWRTQIRISRSSPTGVPEELREPGPGVDLDQYFRQLHPRQAFGNEGVQLNDLVGQLLH